MNKKEERKKRLEKIRKEMSIKIPNKVCINVVEMKETPELHTNNNWDDVRKHVRVSKEKFSLRNPSIALSNFHSALFRDGRTPGAYHFSAFTALEKNAVNETIFDIPKRKRGGSDKKEPPREYVNVGDIREKLDSYKSGKKRFLIIGLDFECKICESFQEVKRTINKFASLKIQNSKGNKFEMEPFWIDIQSPSTEDLQDIGNYFGLHGLTVEDCQENDAGEKWELFGDYLFVNLHTADMIDENLFEELNILIFEELAVTIHKGYFEEMEMLLSRVEGEFETNEPIVDHGSLLSNTMLNRTSSKYDVERTVERRRRNIGRSHSKNGLDMGIGDDYSQPLSEEVMFGKVEEEEEGEGESEDDEENKRKKRNLDVDFEEKGSPMTFRSAFRREKPPTDKKMKKFKKRTALPTPSWVLYAFIDAFVDLYVPITESICHEVERVDEAVLDMDFGSKKNRKKQTDLLICLSKLKKEVYRLKKLMITKQSIVLVMMQSQNLFTNLMAKEVTTLFRDVVDHISQCLSKLDGAKESLNQVHSNYMIKISIEISNSSQQTDDVMNRITVFVSILAPLALISGMWGMNVPVPGGLPSGDLYWFFGIVGVMILITMSSFFFFYPKYWYGLMKSLCLCCYNCELYKRLRKDSSVDDLGKKDKNEEIDYSKFGDYKFWFNQNLKKMNNKRMIPNLKKRRVTYD